MLLSEVVEFLTYGSLSQLAITNNGKEVEPNDYKKFIGYINLGLTQLFTRFNLKQEEAIVRLYDNIYSYRLHDKYATSNTGSSAPIKWIEDSVEYPFKNNVLKIEAIYDEDGVERVLNNSTVENSIYTPQFDIIQVLDPVPTNTLSIIYRANHDKLVVDPSTDLTTIDVDIPSYLLAALDYYLASLLITPVGMEGEGQGTNFLQKYEMECRKIENLGLVNQEVMTDNRITMMGWV